MTQHPGERGDDEDMAANLTALQAEIDALRDRLAALEERRPPAGPAKRRLPTRTAAALAVGAGLAILGGASFVYGQGSVEALFIGKDGRIGIGTATPAARLDVAGQVNAAALRVAGPVMIDGKNQLEFGAGVTPKEGNAGKIGYEMFEGSDALEIVGAGTEGKTKIRLWAQGGATLHGSLAVYGGLAVDGEVDGNLKIVHQIDDQGQTTYQKPLWRYHMTLTAKNYGGRTKTIPYDILEKLCGAPDGCEVRLGMTRWNSASETETASVTNRFYLSSDNHWRTGWGEPHEHAGVIVADGKREFALDAWNTCKFTDGRYENYRNEGDDGNSMKLLVWNGFKGADRTCELTIIP